jgi:hypothetical protein
VASDDLRLGVVSLGEDASLVHPLGSVSDGDERARLDEAVRGLAFSAPYKDLAAGLGIALDQIRLEGREDARRAVVLISDGELEPSASGLPRDEILEELRGQILYEYLVQEVPIFAVAFGDADLELMQEIGGSTRGRSLVAPDSATLLDTLSILGAGLAPASPEVVIPDPVVPVPPAVVAWEPPRVLIVAGGAAAALLVMLVLIALVMLVLNTVRLSSLAPERDGIRRGVREGPQFSSLRKKAGRVTKLLMEARSGLEGLKVDVEDFAAESWEREKALKNRYHGLASGLFLLLDHLEIQVRQEDATVGIEWLVRRLRQNLDREGIEEIEVEEGDAFDGMYHKHAGDRADDRPAGSVLEVARRGWFVRGDDGEDDLILRHAEVIVSTGTAGRAAG